MLFIFLRNFLYWCRLWILDVILHYAGCIWIMHSAPVWIATKCVFMGTHISISYIYLLHWNVFKYKYSWEVQIQLQILLNAKVFKYKYIGKYFSKYFILGIYHYISNRKANHRLRHLVCRHNLCFVTSKTGRPVPGSLAGITCGLETEMLILTMYFKKYLKITNTFKKYLNTFNYKYLTPCLMSYHDDKVNFARCCTSVYKLTLTCWQLTCTIQHSQFRSIHPCWLQVVPVYDTMLCLIPYSKLFSSLFQPINR